MPSSFVIATQRVSFEIANPLVVEWGKTKALRFDLYIIDEKEKDRILVKIPGFVIREFGMSVPQKKVGNKYINLIYIPDETLHIIEERIIDNWGEEFTDVRFPQRKRKEENSL